MNLRLKNQILKIYKKQKVIIIFILTIFICSQLQFQSKSNPDNCDEINKVCLDSKKLLPIKEKYEEKDKYKIINERIKYIANERTIGIEDFEIGKATQLIGSISTFSIDSIKKFIESIKNKFIDFTKWIWENIETILLILGALGVYVKFILEKNIFPSAEFTLKCTKIKDKSNNIILNIQPQIKNVGNSILIANNIRVDIRYLTENDTQHLEIFKDYKKQGRLKFQNSVHDKFLENLSSEEFQEYLYYEIKNKKEYSYLYRKGKEFNKKYKIFWFEIDKRIQEVRKKLNEIKNNQDEIKRLQEIRKKLNEIKNNQDKIKNKFFEPEKNEDNKKQLDVIKYINDIKSNFFDKTKNKPNKIKDIIKDIKDIIKDIKDKKIKNIIKDIKDIKDQLSDNDNTTNKNKLYKIVIDIKEINENEMDVNKLNEIENELNKIEIDIDELNEIIKKANSNIGKEVRGFPILQYRTFINSGVVQEYSYITKIEKSAKYILVRSSFEYAQNSSFIQKFVLKVSRCLGLIQWNLKNVNEPHTIEKVFEINNIDTN